MAYIIGDDTTGPLYIPQTDTTVNNTNNEVINVGKSNSVDGSIDSVKPTIPTVPKFTTTSQQSDGVNKLKRVEFTMGDKSYKFALNPEEFQQGEPNRITVTQTKAGAYVDDFGGGVQTISMKGTTGFKNGTKKGNKGFAKFKELRDLIRQYYFKQAPGTPVAGKNELVFHNYTDGEHWVVVPKDFKLMKSVARPLLYAYDIQLICLRPASQPSGASKKSVYVATLPSVNINDYGLGD